MFVCFFFDFFFFSSRRRHTRCALVTGVQTCALPIFTLRLGSTDDFVTMLASAKLGELKQLCAGTPAARYFAEGGERMLASILGTLAPAIGHLRLISRKEGEPFSIRRWVRGEGGSLWMPSTANPIAALRRAEERTV